MGDEQLAMRLEFDTCEANPDSTESVLSLETSHDSFDASDCGPPPLLHASCVGALRSRQQLNLDKICSDISNHLLHEDNRAQIPSDTPRTSFPIAKISDCFCSSLDLTNRSRELSSFKRKHSVDNCETPSRLFIAGAGCDKKPQQQQFKLKTPNTSDFSVETSKDCYQRLSSMSAVEHKSGDQMRPRDVDLVNDEQNDDIRHLHYERTNSSTSLPTSALSTSVYQQQRQPKLLKQNAFSVSQELPWKPNALSVAPDDKAPKENSHPEVAVTLPSLKSTKGLTSVVSSDYALPRSQQFLDSPSKYDRGGGFQSLDKQYFSGMASISHRGLPPARTNSGASYRTAPNLNRRKSSPYRLQLETPFCSWSNIGDVPRQMFHSQDEHFERFTRLQREGALHVAYRRAFSEHIKPFGYLRDLRMLRHISQEDGMMEESSSSEDGMMNFSGIHNQNGFDVPNGHAGNNNGDCGHDSVMPPNMTAAKSSPVLVGAAKRKGKPSMDPSAVSMSAAAHSQQQLQQQQQNLLMMAAQQGLSQQQLQHTLQQQQGISPSLQQMIQQQSLAMQQVQHQKLHEQLLHSLNEQLQMNLMHQAQLLKDPSGKSGKSAVSSISNHSLQALLMQHQQIMQQIQLVQRQFALASVLQPFGMHQGMMSPAELQQLWKEVSLQSGVDDNALKVNGLSSTAVSSHSSNNFTISNGPSNKLSTLTPYLNGELECFNMTGMKSDPTTTTMSSSSTSSSKDKIANGNSSVPSHPLYVNRCCKWPNCEAHLEEFSSFIKHLNTEHQLDDRSTAQSRVQMEVVSSLESQLAFQKKVLKAMTDHLHQQSLIPPPAPPISQPQSSLASMTAQHSSPLSSLMSTSSQLSPQAHDLKAESLIPHLLPKPPLLNPNLFAGFLPPVSMVSSPIMPIPPSHRPPQLVSTPGSHGSGLSSSQPPTPTRDGCSSGGSSRGGSEGGGPVRRRVSDKCNLPISAEIHRNREFYKNTDVRPPFTYASLIRQAIIESPHRQLTLNEIYQWFQNTFAYFRRNEATWKNAVRHNLSLHKCFMRVENVKGAVWTVDEIEFYKRRPQKLGTSPGNMKHSHNDSASYNESLSASLRVALGEGMGMIGAGILPDQESAQDLSMKATGHDGYNSGGFDEAELMMRIKQEVQEVYPDLDFSNPRPPSYHCSPSSQQDDHDPKGIEVKGGQMVMMPEMMDHYDNRDNLGQTRRKVEETGERGIEMDKKGQRMNDSADYDEESSREHEERQHFEEDDDDDEMCNLDRSSSETEAERELRSVQEKFEREQAEDLRNEYSSLENGYRSKGERSYNRHHHYMSMPARFSPLKPTHVEEGQQHCSEGHHFLGRSLSLEERVSNKHGSSDTSVFATEKQGSKSAKDLPDDVKDVVGHKADSSTTRPFVVQLPDSGPVFPTSLHQTTTSRASSIDIAVSGTS